MYEMIFKRKSFHLFRNTGSEKLTEDALGQIREIFGKLHPLYPQIRTGIRIVPAGEKLLGRGAEYAIEIYSEKKENYLMNAGYLGQQLDLWLASQNIGALWFGMGKPEAEVWDGLHYVIMILIAKVDSPDKFRKDMFRSKRKPLAETWAGEEIPGVSDIARFAPSACNSQPWRVKNEDGKLTVSRMKKPGRVGLMSPAAAFYNNRIDMGIYLCILELCLAHEDYTFTRTLFADTAPDREESPVAEYEVKK